ncbi:MAG: DinB family protein [Tuberibacillus sp.]
MTVSTLRDVIMHEMSLGVKSTISLLKKVNPADWGYRPAENMRTLKELADHLAAIPEVDLAIMNEKSEDDIHQLETKYAHMKSADELAQAMESGFKLFKEAISSLPEEVYLTKESKPFYADFSSTQAKWHVEVVTHIFHHRAQFFNYLKQLGYDVNMFDLYV